MSNVFREHRETEHADGSECKCFTATFYDYEGWPSMAEAAELLSGDTRRQKKTLRSLKKRGVDVRVRKV